MMLSIVIPLYNKGPDIQRAIASVLAQTHQDFELIVVDDGSKDDGPAQVRACTDPRVRLVQQPNGGVSSARNLGVAQAGGDYVCFLDADDHWAPEHLSRLVAVMNAHPGLSFYAAAFNFVDEHGAVQPLALTPALQGRCSRIEQFFEAAMACPPLVQTSAVMVRRATFQALGGFQVGLKAGEDILLWSRLAAQGPLGYSGFHTSNYSAPPLSAETRGTAVNLPPEVDVVGDHLLALTAERGQQLKGLRAYTALWFRGRAMLFLESARRRQALCDLRKAVVTEGRVQARDVVSVALMLLPLSLQRRALAALRALRQREEVRA
ncbi:MAG: hypothetical protein RI907_1669 [Pseudomonadota bacterium]|jgi:hypothetical protein